ncbi:two-component response regulator ORR23 [Panicum miliaceum]|uniref:Two-component response regulator ORR23 n=1 Tax=Panicum miliaceum TaxID=4540 RepID=A0A3L6RVS3_PANMI|nr:two-component response regulator ORR23 [Panicum miliaceum]
MQKYRLYLKRLRAVASHQASIVAALGGSDPFMRMGAFEGLQSYQDFTTSAALSSFSPQGLLTRNNPTSFGIQGMAASRPIQIATVNSTISHSTGDANKYQLSLPGTSNRQGNLAQGLKATSVGQVQLPQKWIQEETHDLSTIIPGNGLVNGVPGTLRSVADSPLLQQDLVERRQAKIVIQPSSSANSERLEGTAGVSSSLMDSHISQQSGLLLSAFSASTVPMNGSFSGTNVAKLGATSSGSTNICPSHDLRVARYNDVGDSSFGSVILLPPDTAQNQKYLNFGGGSSVRHNMDGGNADSLLDAKLAWSSLPTSQPPSAIGSHHPLSQRPNNGSLGVKMIEQRSASIAAPQTKVDMFISGDILTPKNASDLSFPRLNSELSSSSCSFDGLLNSIIKMEKDDASFSDDLGCDFYSLGACI